MPRNARELDRRTLRSALALDRGPRAWRAAARVHSLGRLADAGAGGGLRELLGGVSEPRETSDRDLADRLERADPDEEQALMADLGVGLVCVGDADYPPLLASAPDPPAALWVRGELVLGDAWSIAVVGARRATPYGVEQAGRIASALAGAEVTVISGAARGIDAEAHRGALRAEGRTVAIVGGGLANPYPPEHLDLLDEIVAAGGAVVSECPMRAEATPDRFPSRNRIIAGMSLGTLVIEAAHRSGAIITAGMAVDLGRLCMALPGSVSSGRSSGCHQLIASMQAALIESSDDALRLLVEHAATVRGAEALAAAGIRPPTQVQPMP